MSERQLRREVVRALCDAGLDAISVENPCHPGTPDVNFVHGWLELKVAKKPRRGEDVVRVPHFTPQQAIWLSRRVSKGGGAWLFLQIEDEFLLFQGDAASEVVGKCSIHALKSSSVAYWNRKDGAIRRLAAWLSSCTT